MDLQLQEYVRSVRAQGASDAQIRETLVKEGWNSAAIDEVLGAPSAPAPIGGVTRGAPLTSAGGLLHQAFALYGNRFGVLLSYSFVAAIGAALPIFVETLGFSKILVLVLQLFSYVCYAVATIGVLTELSSIKGEITLGAGVVVSLKKLPSYFFAGILYSLAAFGGSMLFLIPGIYVSIYGALSQYANVLDGHRGMNAVMASRAYIMPYGGKVLWRMIVLAIIVALPLIVIGLFTGSINPGSTQIDPSFTDDSVPMQIVAIIWQLFTLPLSVSYYFLMYQELKAKHGTASLDLQVGRGKYTGLMVFGLVVIPLFIIMAVGAVGLALLGAASGEAGPGAPSILQAIAALIQ